MNDKPDIHAPEPDADTVARLGLGTNRRRRGWRFYALVGGGVVALLIILRLIFGGGSGVHYVTQAVTRGPLSITVTATGTLAPRDKVDVGAEVSGRLDEVNVDFNDHVKKGEILAKINTDQLRAQLAQADATLAQAKATVTQDSLTLKRYRALAKHNAIAPQTLDTAIADLARARASVKLAEAQAEQFKTQIGRATIRSPINGVVLDRKVEAGQTVAATFQTPVLFTLASDLSEMELDVDIDEADVGEVHAGQDATFTVDAYPNKTFHAKLISVHLASQTVQNVVTYQGVLTVNNPKGLLKPGMTATVTILADHITNALQVPNAALRFIAPEALTGKAPPPPSEPNRGRVWTVDGKTLKPHDLTLGPTDGRMTQVIKGDLKPGEKVVTDIKSPDSNSQ